MNLPQLASVCITALVCTGTLAGKIVPVLCGSAKEYHGVRLLLLPLMLA